MIGNVLLIFREDGAKVPGTKGLEQVPEKRKAEKC
jgi:hypothetical protein